MKKFCVMSLVVGIIGIFTLPVFAEGTCNCTSSYIVNKLKNASSSDLNALFDKMIDQAAWYSSFSTEDSLAELIYEIRDEYDFKNALKYYINNNCSVSGTQIICR